MGAWRNQCGAFTPFLYNENRMVTHCNVQTMCSSFFSTTFSRYFSCDKYLASYGDFTPSSWYATRGHTETNGNSLRSDVRAMASVALTHAVNPVSVGIRHEQYGTSIALLSLIFHHKRLNFDLLFIKEGAGVLTITIGSTLQFPA